MSDIFECSILGDVEGMRRCLEEDWENIDKKDRVQ